MNSFKDNITDYILSGHAILLIRTHEIKRCISQISKIAEKINSQIQSWSIAAGWKSIDGKPIGEQIEQTPEAAIQYISGLDENNIIVLEEFGHYLDIEKYTSADVIISWMHEIKENLSASKNILIIIDGCAKLPDSLKYDVTEIDFPLPDEDIENHIRFVCEGVDKDKFTLDESILPLVVSACRGMTCQQIVDKVALSITKHKKLDHDAVKTIINEKANILKSSGLLRYIESPPGGLSLIGGYEPVKNYIKLDKPCFSKEAKDFGIDFPKGIMLAGVPGTGKTALSLAIASEFEMPLISMDVGSLMSKYVGDSEANIREAIKIIESIAPCVLQLDEIEKGFSTKGDLDGGTSARVLGTMLSWMNDRTSPVYFVCTANNVENLPPEFCRKGRLDEIFGLDLPNEQERLQIWEIHIKKRNRDIKKYKLNELVKASQGFTGADIEQAVKLGLKIAFAQSQELDNNHLLTAVDGILPLSKAEPERIKIIQQWIDVRAKKANQTEIKVPVNKRSVRMEK